jgi:metal-dependent amidase/aminoacylase/carboxypeptidase family protein
MRNFVSHDRTILRPPLSTPTYHPQLDRYFHANPELSFQEESTAASIVKHLGSLNAYEIHASIGGHGVAAVLKNGPGKALLLRADIDALPVEERTGLAYASTKRMKDLEGLEKGVMHACGHDM